jgi:hypothetical protein
VIGHVSQQVDLKGYLPFCVVICHKFIYLFFFCIGWQNTCAVKFSVRATYVRYNAGTDVMVDNRSHVDTANFAQNDLCNSVLKASTLYVKHYIFCLY